MRIATWNVNSLRARRDAVLDWFARAQPDIALLQETKCTDAHLPVDDLAALGYDLAHHGRDHWNGVAIASRVGLEEIERGFAGTNRPPFDEARIIGATCGGIRVFSVYVPNGRELDDPHYLFKLVWLERLRAHVDFPGPRIVAGDFNVAPSDIDIYDPKRWRRRTHASAEERAAIAALLDTGLVDVTRANDDRPGVYTWWGYRPGMFEQNRGLRIDLLLASTDLAGAVVDTHVDRETRSLERPSDHAPVIMDLALAGRRR